MSQPVTKPRAQLLPLQGVVNRLNRALLRAPLLSRLIGKRLVTVYVVGRKSGRRYSIPLAYMRDGRTLVISSPFPWIRNLRTGDPVEIQLLGRRRTADVEVLTDESAVTRSLAMMARDNHQFARFNRIAIDEQDQPDANDLHLAWEAGARVALLTPR